MSKELTPLEAYNRLCSHLDYDNSDYMHNGSYEEDNEIIETALKDYEYLKLVAKPLTDEEKKSINSVAKRLKALEIIANNIEEFVYFNIRANRNEKRFIININNLDHKEQFDFLKEVLK